MKRFLVLAGVILGLVTGTWLSAFPTHAQGDGISAVQAFIRAFNAYDADAASKLITTDFEMRIIYGTPDDPTFTPEALPDVLNGVKQDHFQLQVAGLVQDGANVTGTYTGDGDQIREVGIGPETGTVAAVVENGRVKSIIFTVDPEYNRRSEEAIAAKEKLPETGADVTTPLMTVFALGLVMLLGGALFLARRRQHN